VLQIPLEELSDAALTQQNTVYIFSNTHWRLSMTELEKMMSTSRIRSHYNCALFPTKSLVKKADTLPTILKKPYPAYVSDYDIRECKSLEAWINNALSVLGVLQPEGVLNLLRILWDTHRPMNPLFASDTKDYSYVNLYLYVGNKGTGTAIHDVSVVPPFLKTKVVTHCEIGYLENAGNQHRF